MSQMQEMPETHGERLELMRLFGRLRPESGKFGRCEQVFFVSEGWMSVANGPDSRRNCDRPRIRIGKKS